MNTCFFCGYKPADETCAFEQPLYRLVHYAHLGVVRRFEYEKQIIPVPRCPDCAQAHAKAKKIRKTCIIVGAVAGFIIGFPIPAGCLFTATAGGIIGFLISKKSVRKLYNRLQTKGTEASALKQHPPIGEKLKDRWTMKKKK